jgi:hypothetical protein
MKRIAVNVKKPGTQTAINGFGLREKFIEVFLYCPAKILNLKVSNIGQSNHIGARPSTMINTNYFNQIASEIQKMIRFGYFLKSALQPH